MRTDTRGIAFAHPRLSNEEAAEGESSSIMNQRISFRITVTGMKFFCPAFLSITTGGNFGCPAFQEMIALLEQGKANIGITKDLSRLDRDM